MVSRRKLVAALAVGAAPAVVAMACSFPDVEYAGPQESEAGVDAGPDVTEDSVAADVVTVDVVVRDEDAEVIADAAICATRPPCDCDLDGYLADDCDAGPDATGPFGDCDDLDAFRHPGQIFTTERPKDGGSWDWNCDGVVEKAYDENPTCQGIATLCSGQGFKQEIPCGEVGEFYTCDGLICSLSNYAGPQTQPCK